MNKILNKAACGATHNVYGYPLGMNVKCHTGFHCIEDAGPCNHKNCLHHESGVPLSRLQLKIDGYFE